MAKVPKLTNSTKALPDRIGRKATTSTLSKDRSPPSLHTSTYLAPDLSGAIIKKRHQKPLKRKQRLRLQAGKQKAEDIRGKNEIKVLGSVGRGRRRNGRRKPWEEVDENIAKEGIAGKGRKKGSKRNGRIDLGQEGENEEVEMVGHFGSDGVKPALKSEDFEDGEGRPFVQDLGIGRND